MTRLTESDLAEIRARNPVAEVAAQYVQLRRNGRGMIGPCPVCGGGDKTGTRFEIFEDGESWACAVCGKGGDVIRLVQMIEACDFRAAIEKLGGVREIDQEAAAKLLAKRETKRLAREKASEGYRERERKALWQLWEQGGPIDGTPAAAYLAGRGLDLPEICPGLRFHADMPYWHGDITDDRGRRQPRKIHSGPALLGAFIRPDNRFGGLHITWLEDTPAGWRKIDLVDFDTSAPLPAKKMRGSKTGAHILIAPTVLVDVDRVRRPRRLVIGEGTETVLSVFTPMRAEGRNIADMEFWAAGDLGNLAGPATETVPHPTERRPNGSAQRVPGPVPEPEGGLTIPDSVEELILLGDGDSDPFLTTHAMTRAARRYARDGRTVRVAFAPEGLDFNDVLQGEAA